MGEIEIVEAFKARWVLVNVFKIVICWGEKMKFCQNVYYQNKDMLVLYMSFLINNQIDFFLQKKHFM